MNNIVIDQASGLKSRYLFSKWRDEGEAQFTPLDTAYFEELFWLSERENNTGTADMRTSSLRRCASSNERK